MNTHTEPRERPEDIPAGARGAAARRQAWRDAVWDSVDLKPADKLVALAYAQFAGEDPLRVFVARETLERMTGLGRTAYTAARRRLEEGGWLTVTEKARQRFSTRYALTMPHAVSGQPSRFRTAETVSCSESDPQGLPSCSESDASRSHSDTSRSESDPQRISAVRNPTPAVHIPTPAVRNPTPIQNHNQNHNQPTSNHPDPEPAPTEHPGALDRLVAEIRSQRLGATLTPTVLTAHAVALHAAGWTPPDLATALAAKDFTGARGSGLLRHHLNELATTGPAAPAPAPDTARCADHTTMGASTCSSCWSEVKTGERHPDDVGRIPGRTPQAVPA